MRLDLTITGLAKALLDSQIEQERSTQEFATRLLSTDPCASTSFLPFAAVVPRRCSTTRVATPEALLRILRERKGGTDALGDTGDH